jgi:hypothetical protein
LTNGLSFADAQNMSGSEIMIKTVHLQQILQQEKQLHPSREMPEKLFYVTDQELEEADTEKSKT